MASKHKTERSGHGFVEALMNGGKHALVILLSALWLCASGQSLLAPCDSCRTGASASPNHILDAGKSCPCSPFSNSDFAGTAIHSGVTKHLGKAGPIVCENACRSSVLAAPADIQCSLRHSAQDRATSWQFVCRAALDPRAPSSVL